MKLLSLFKSLLQSVCVGLCQPRGQALCKLGAALGFMFFAGHVFADGGTDVLAGTTADATMTMGASGKKWLYLIEGVSAIIAYRATKNIYVLGSVVGVALFANILLTMAK